MKNQVNIGILGCGSIFRSMHLPSLLKQKDKFSIVAAYDPNPQSIELTKKAVGENSAIKFAASAREIINDTSIDAIAILTRTSVHVKYAIDALKHVSMYFWKSRPLYFLQVLKK